MHSVLVVIQYIVEYYTCIKLKMAKRKLQTELSLQQKSEVLLRIQKAESQRRNNIKFRALCVEFANVDKEAADDWKRHLATVLEGYAIEDQFNADETAVFYWQLLRKSMVFKGESCKVGKFAKERMSIMLCCSATERS